ncbi:hypothetical protein VNO77_23820 [Canavalia gladiata]|uniref:Uncharacterized protein n=1 Tax=Canavalia gladiata TaxID=3824 RepID=A0AAN9LAD6_CANGL
MIGEKHKSISNFMHEVVKDKQIPAILLNSHSSLTLSLLFFSLNIVMRKTKKAESSEAVSSERRNWGNIFNLLVQMVRNQQNQLQSFANNHKFLEDRLRMQHEGWASNVRIHKDQISQMKGLLIFEEKKRLLEAAKADLTVGFKQRETSMLKWILENMGDELADFKAWFEYLTRKSSNGEDQGTASKDSGNKSSRNSTEKDKCSHEAKDELRMLKGDYEKLALEKSSELLALLAEKKFVWNQYNIMENNYSDKLRSKQAEVEKANEKIKVLVSRMEQLQSENNEKDSKISELGSKVTNMEAETKRLNKEISGLSVELESLRKFRNDQVTPVLNHCLERTKTSDLGTSKNNRSRRNKTLNKEICSPERTKTSVLNHCSEETKTSDLGTSKNNRSRRNKTLNKEICSPERTKTSVLNHCSEETKTSDLGTSKNNRSTRNMTLNKEICSPDASAPAKSSEKGTKSLKRKEVPAVMPTSETPKLFSSSFKVPKLKPSLRVR